MTHPRDHILSLSYQGSTSQTDVSKVSVKVRVNGGAATTYTSLTTPAVAQAADCSFAYHLEIPASTYTDGDRVSRTWLYNGTAYAYGDTIIGPAQADETVIAAIKAKTDTIGSLTVTVTAPVAASGTVEVLQGDDYKAADSRALQWTITGGPSLTSATVTLKAKKGQTSQTYTGSVSSNVVTVELTAAQTAALDAGQWTYSLVATLSDGDVATLATGRILVSTNPQ